MSSLITCGELAELASKLPEGELKKWCDLSSAGAADRIVFADSEMLSRCQEAASSSTQERAKSESKKCKVSKTMKDKPGTSL